MAPIPPNLDELEKLLALLWKVVIGVAAAWAAVWRFIKWLMLPRIKDTIHDTLKAELAEIDRIAKVARENGENIQKILRHLKHLIENIDEYKVDHLGDFDHVVEIVKDNRTWLDELSGLLDHALGIDRRTYRDRRNVDQLIERLHDRRKEQRRRHTDGDPFLDELDQRTAEHELPSRERRRLELGDGGDSGSAGVEGYRDP